MRPEDGLADLPAGLPDSGGPAYVRLSDLPAQAIADGTLKQGHRLPRHAALATRYEVSKNTAYYAVQHLLGRGLIRKDSIGRSYVHG